MTELGNEQTRPQAENSPRQRAVRAYDNARGRATDTLGQAPLIALAGGIAAGALIAALLPRTQGETRLVRAPRRGGERHGPGPLRAAPGHPSATPRQARVLPR